MPKCHHPPALITVIEYVILARVHYPRGQMDVNPCEPGEPVWYEVACACGRAVAVRAGEVGPAWVEKAVARVKGVWA